MNNIAPAGQRLDILQTYHLYYAILVGYQAVDHHVQHPHHQTKETKASSLRVKHLLQWQYLETLALTHTP